MKLLYIVLFGLASLTVSAQTYVRGHYNGAGHWVRGHYRPYYPGDINRPPRRTVIVVVPQPAKPAPAAMPPMPDMKDHSGAWVESEVAREKQRADAQAWLIKERDRLEKQEADKRKLN